MKPPEDAIGRMMESWQQELPGLDPSALGVVGRVIVLAKHLEKSVGDALVDHGLSLGQFDILATLRRHGPRGGMTPKQLLSSVMLTSGGMTARLTGLEELGFIIRKDDPTDRRGVVVELTTKGRKMIDAAAETRFAEAQRSLPPFEESELVVLEKFLKRWLLTVESPQSVEQKVASR